MTLPTPTPEELQAMRERYGLSAKQFGMALGFSKDQASRTVRAYEVGSRHGQPFRPTGTALAAIRYYGAIWEALLADDMESSAAVAAMRRVLNDAIGRSGE